MPEDLKLALVGAVGGVVGGMVTGFYSHARSWCTKPRLSIDYVYDDARFCNFDAKNWEGKDISGIYVRVRVINHGRRVARNCRVFLTGLDEVHPSGQTTQTNFHDGLVLSWPGEDFEPKDIPRGIPFYADVVSVSKNVVGWHFCVSRLYANNKSLPEYHGTYRFHVLITADDADPAECTVDVTYHGDWHNFRAVPVP